MQLKLLPVLALCAVTSQPSWAALGGDVDSVLRDHVALGATDVLTQTESYDIHEALTKIPVANPEQKGKVVDVIEKGYYLYDRVIRFARVVVGN